MTSPGGHSLRPDAQKCHASVARNWPKAGNSNLIGKSASEEERLHAPVKCIMWGLCTWASAPGVYEVNLPTTKQWLNALKVIEEQSHHCTLLMDFVDAYFLSSPASAFVALVTVAFLLNQAWPRLFRQKQIEKVTYTPTLDDQTSSLTVFKEPEVPEGWWSSREVFELERRALFSKVIQAEHTTPFRVMVTDSRHSPGSTLPTPLNSAKPAPISLLASPGSPSS